MEAMKKKKKVYGDVYRIRAVTTDEYTDEESSYVVHETSDLDEALKIFDRKSKGYPKFVEYILEEYDRETELHTDP